MFLQIQVAFGLVNQYQVPEKSIAIACTTLAQQDNIAKKLEQTYSDFVVCTVQDLQGLFYLLHLLSTPQSVYYTGLDSEQNLFWLNNYDASKQIYVDYVEKWP